MGRPKKNLNKVKLTLEYEITKDEVPNCNVSAEIPENADLLLLAKMFGALSSGVFRDHIFMYIAERLDDEEKMEEFIAAFSSAVRYGYAQNMGLGDRAIGANSMMKNLSRTKFSQEFGVDEMRAGGPD